MARNGRQRHPRGSTTRGLILAVATSAVATSTLAENLVIDPGFDVGIDDWYKTAVTTLSHSAVDEKGSPFSGSIRLEAMAGSTAAYAFLCLPVVAGRTYAFGGSARLAGGPDQPFGHVDVSFSTMTDCATLGLDTERHPNAVVALPEVWGTTQSWVIAPPGAVAARFAVGVVTTSPGPAPLVAWFDNLFFLEDETCGPSPTTLCLGQGRFRVTVEWETKSGATGYGHATVLTDDSGYFWFFDDANVELVVKVLDACATQFNTYWVFAAGLTNVETVLRVHDTLSDAEKVYTNPLETPFAPIQDTDAFATCLSLGG